MAHRIPPVRVWQIVLSAVLIFAAPLRAQQAGGTYDVEGLYLQGYMLMMDAEKLEGQKNFAGSFYKYQEARDVFDSVARTHPGWQTNMVNNRRNLIRKKMEEVRQRERERRAAAGTTTGANPDLLPPLENPSGAAPVPTPPQTLPGIPANPRAPIDDRLGEMQRQIGRYSAENQRLQETMTAREGELFKVKQELLANKQELNAALERQIELQNKVDTADQKRDRELGDLKKQLEETTTALTRATKIQDEATTRIDGLMTELSQARESIAQLSREKEALTEERNQMLALIQSKGSSKGSDALLEENRRLKGLLDEANVKVAALSKDKAAAQKEVAGLRDEVAKVRDELERTKKENEDYRQQIAGLRTRLEEVSGKLLAAPMADRPDSELAGENRMLRKMILDQLKHQAYREQKKRLALEQLAKLQINNDELLGTINELATPPPSLSADEQGVLQDPQMNAFMEGRGIGATIIARTDGASAPGTGTAAEEASSRPARGRSELPPDLRTVADAGTEAFRRNRAWEAERAFATILKSDPTNVYALSNVAVAQLKQGKFGETERNLKKALAYQENDAFAHHLLGLAAYRQGKLDDAERSLRIALGLDGKNARAHFTLGLVYNRRGHIEDACREFLDAVEADPAYADAHYNLAVIYASRDDLTRAISHYNKALENGSERDPKLEKALGQPLGAR